jgi:hypothetical protein
MALKRKQREQLGSNQRENRATGKEGEADHNVTSTALGKEEMVIRL